MPMKIANRRVGRPRRSLLTTFDWSPLTIGDQSFFKGFHPEKRRRQVSCAESASQILWSKHHGLLCSFVQQSQCTAKGAHVTLSVRMI